MAHVVFHQKLEFVLGAGCYPLVPRGSRVRMTNHMRQAPVVGQPEFHDLQPIATTVVLSTYPIVLLVSRERYTILVLQAYEALMVVRCGVDEVPEDFFLRPLFGAGRLSRGVLGDPSKERISMLQRVFQLFRDLSGCHANDGSNRGDYLAEKLKFEMYSSSLPGR